MSRDEVRDLIETAWRHYDHEADTYKDSTHAVLRFTAFFGEISAEMRPAADEMMLDWALSGHPKKRFVALAVIEDFSITSVLPALRELQERYERSNEWSAPYDWAKVNRIIGTIAAGVPDESGTGPR